ncbi:MAG TPA: outer membrane beta-barrel protein [Burkholderiales bacterium]|nr:outer membrane beta-barrel protein [Burkholderiales bacterium]
MIIPPRPSSPKGGSAWSRALLIAALALLCPFAAHADEESGRWYLGAGAGQSTGKQFCDTTAGVTAVANCDDSATSVRLFTGYQINRYLGIEGGYLRLGKFTADRTIGGTTVTDEFKTYTAYFEGVATLPLGDHFGLYAKAGGLYWSIKTSGTLAGVAGPDNSKGGFDFIGGAGAQFFFTRTFGIRAEYEFIPKLGDSATGEVDVGIVSASLIWKF